MTRDYAGHQRQIRPALGRAVRLDIGYVENWSVALDIQILWKTWSAVTHRTGAY